MKQYEIATMLDDNILIWNQHYKFFMTFAAFNSWRVEFFDVRSSNF